MSFQCHPNLAKAGISADTSPASTPAQMQNEVDYFGRQHDLSSRRSAAKANEIEKQAQLERLASMEEHKRRFAASRDSLVSAINQTGTVLTSLRDFNKKRWIIHYPAVDRMAPASHGRSDAKRHTLHRSQPLCPPENGDDLTLSSPILHHPGLHRSSTEQVHASKSGTDTTLVAKRSRPRFSKASCFPEEASVALEKQREGDEAAPAATEDVEHTAEQTNEMSVLRLDLKLGAIGNSPQALVYSLEKSSVAQLLDERMISSIRQLDNLRHRISDTQSKVLVTGDLNAGKSTFVNSLMRRKLMPVDQQPCTTVFCEVLDAEHANEGREEVHLIRPGMIYDFQNDNTYTRHSLADIEQIVIDAEDLSPEDAPMLKCYCHDTRSTQESLLRNGIVDIALIDAPGLNRDSLKTTALFARQEEIDVIVFVVSAENHFTLSAKEFLWNASNDKAYIFIVVNKFDQIYNKDKCKRLVLEQIKQLSPRTYKDAEALVHFVDSDSVFGGDDGATPMTLTPTGKLTSHDTDAAEACSTLSPEMSFTRLEACLRDFVLQRREKSKLMPAQTYLLRLLSDVEFLSQTNLDVANAKLDEARRLLEDARPALAHCKAAHAKIEARLEGEEDGVVSSICRRAETDLDAAVGRIGQGKPASDAVSLPPYPGFLSALNYAASVRDVFLQSLELVVREAEQAARDVTAEALVQVKEMGDAHLPADVERSNREFCPEAMFSKRLRRQGYGILGLGLSEQTSEARLSDVFDVHYYLHVVTRSSEDEDDINGADSSMSAKKLSEREEELSIVSGVSLGLGALTLMGSKAYGAKSALDALFNVLNLVSNPTVRKWASTAIGLATAGFAIYIVHDLPRSIPRNVGRSMRMELASPQSSRSGRIDGFLRRFSLSLASVGQAINDEELSSTTITPQEKNGVSVGSGALAVSFTVYHQQRLSREVRKVLRLAGWDLQERFRVALAERRGLVERLEGQETKSQEALVWFCETRQKVDEVRSQVRDVEIA